MELTVQKESFLKALAIAQPNVAKKNTNPILLNILLSAAENCLRVCATDLETGALLSLPANVKTPGSTTISAKTLVEVVRELPDGEVHIKLGERERAEIRAKNSVIRLVGNSAHEYPTMEGFAVHPETSIPSEVFSEMIAKTVYAVSNDENRFALSGVCCEIESEGKGKERTNVLKMVATDGHRLAVIKRPAGDLFIDSRIIIPKRALLEVKRVFSENSAANKEGIGLAVKGGFFVSSNQEVKLVTRLIDGEYPSYDQVIPKSSGAMVVINAQEFAQALRRTSLVVSDKTKCVKLEFSDNTLKISGKSADLGDAEEVLDCQYTGDPVQVGFNASYILDFIGSISDSELRIDLHGQTGAARFSSMSDDGYFGIIMPMRV